MAIHTVPLQQQQTHIYLTFESGWATRIYYQFPPPVRAVCVYYQFPPSARAEIPLTAAAGAVLPSGDAGPSQGGHHGGADLGLPR